MDLLLAYNPASMARHAYQSEGAIFPIFGILFVLVVAGVILAYSYEEITKRLTPHFHEKTVRRITIFLILAELAGMVYIDRNHTHMISGLAKAAARAKEAGKFSPKKVSVPRTHSFQEIPLVTAGHGAKFPHKGWFGLGGSTAPQITLNDGLGGLKSFDIFDCETGQLVDFGSKKELKAAVQELERYEIPEGYAEKLTYPIADARAYYERKLRLIELVEEWDRRKATRDVVSGLAEARQQGMPLERYAASWAEYGPGNMPEALVAAGYDLKKVEAAAGRPINFEDPEYRDYLKDIIGPRDVNVSLREDVAPLIRIPDELSEARDRMGYLIYGISDEIPDSIDLPDTAPSAHLPFDTPLLGGADLTADAIRGAGDAELEALVNSFRSRAAAQSPPALNTAETFAIMEQRHRFLEDGNEKAAEDLEQTFRLPPREDYTPANGRPNINDGTSTEKIVITPEDLDNSPAARLPEDVPTNGGGGRVPSLEDIAGMSNDALRRYVRDQMAREPGQLDEHAAAAFPRYREYLGTTGDPLLGKGFEQVLRNRHPEVFSSHSEGTPTPIAQPAPPNDAAPVPQPSTTARPGTLHPAGQRWRVHTFSEEFANKCNLNECIASHVKFIVSDK